MKKLLSILLLVLILISCKKTKTELYDGIHSSAVAFAYKSNELADFFKNPAKAYVSGFFMFEDDLADDIIFGLDIEWMEGVENYVNFEGADWMALAGFSRQGILWFPVGSPENLTGTPTNTDKWETRQLGTELAPNLWYKMTIVADFNTKDFTSVKIDGNGINQEFDLSAFQLEYPNYVPFDRHCFTYYTFALRNREWAPENKGGTKVYFDDIEFGLVQDTSYTEIFTNGFENQQQIQIFPVKMPVSPLNDMQENHWYLENEDAKIKIVNEKQRNGQYAMECDANLMKH